MHISRIAGLSERWLLQIFIVRDSLLDVVSVKPIYFSDTKVVLKNVPDGTIILSRPLQGAFAGLLVKKYTIYKINCFSSLIITISLS